MKKILQKILHVLEKHAEIWSIPGGEVHRYVELGLLEVSRVRVCGWTSTEEHPHKKHQGEIYFSLELKKLWFCPPGQSHNITNGLEETHWLWAIKGRKIFLWLIINLLKLGGYTVEYGSAILKGGD